MAAPPLAIAITESWSLDFINKNWLPSSVISASPDLIESLAIWKLPIVPSVASTYLTTISPSGFTWNLDELISIFPFEPLTNCESLPKKNLGVLKVTALPDILNPLLSNWSSSPTENLLLSPSRKILLAFAKALVPVPRESVAVGESKKKFVACRDL